MSSPAAPAASLDSHARDISVFASLGCGQRPALDVPPARPLFAARDEWMTYPLGDNPQRVARRIVQPVAAPVEQLPYAVRIRICPSAETVLGLEDDKGDPKPRESQSRPNASRPGTDDDDLGIGGQCDGRIHGRTGVSVAAPVPTPLQPVSPAVQPGLAQWEPHPILDEGGYWAGRTYSARANENKKRVVPSLADHYLGSRQQKNEAIVTYKVTGLSPALFEHLFGLPDDELREHGVRRYIVDKTPGFPDRIEMRDANIGETVLLLNHVSQSADTPYRASHAIFVSERSKKQFSASDTIPDVMRLRLLSLRAFDQAGYIVDADVVDGTDVEQVIGRLFSNPSVSYIHVHNAKQGCYSGRIDRD